MALSTLRKPWSISTFERERPHLTTFVKEEILPLLDSGEIRRILIRAPVKSGKREMVEYIALRDFQSKGQKFCEHAFISAFHRIADKEQRSEIEAHDLKVFSINNKKKADELVAWVRQTAQGKQVVLHLDECDYGAGERQHLSYVWREIKDNVWITVILYSATPEEAKLSGEIEEDIDEMIENITKEAHYVEYTPPEGFCGPGRYLSENLVTKAEQFFHKQGDLYVISQQGKQIIQDLHSSITMNPRRNILILRLSHGMEEKTRGKENKAIHTFVKNLCQFDELRDFIIFVDKGEKFENTSRSFVQEDIRWSERMYWDSKVEGRPIIIILDLTSSRSTEWSCHDRVFATHDYRCKPNFSVCSQAQERPNHYEAKYGGFQPIRIYGHLKTFQLSAGMINYDQYLQLEYRKQKVDRRRSGDQVVYQIKDTSNNSIHPEHNGMYSDTDADDILRRLDCLVAPILSARVKGSIKHHQEITCEFRPCTNETFASLGLPIRNNPFLKSIEEMAKYPDRYPAQNGQIGYLRSWKVWDYIDIEEEKGWGFCINTTISRATICYKDGVLGIALRRPTGVITTESSLTSYKSMYDSRDSHA
jgi:cation transport regulator ChaB